MQFKTLTGRTRRIVKPKKYLINWSGPSRSKLQRRVKTFLEQYWKNQIVFEEFPVAGTKLSLDFYNANKKIAIEVQGEQHNRYVPHFHGSNKINYINQLRRDQEKLKFCEINEINLIEIYQKDMTSESFFDNLASNI